MTMNSLIYLAAPYSHPDPAVMDRRFHEINAVAAQLMQSGEFIFSPISHTHPIAMAGGLPTGWDFWEKYDRAILSACCEVRVLMLDGWRESRGVTAEIAIAIKLGLPVTYIDLPAASPDPAPGQKPQEDTTPAGVPPVSFETGAGTGFFTGPDGVRRQCVDGVAVEPLVKWEDLKPMEWYQYRIPADWSRPYQKQPFPTALNSPAEFRRCEPPKWWREYQLEKDIEIAKVLHPPDAETINKYIEPLIPEEMRRQP